MSKSSLTNVLLHSFDFICFGWMVGVTMAGENNVFVITF
jgi:hypothetical protein